MVWAKRTPHEVSKVTTSLVVLEPDVGGAADRQDNFLALALASLDVGNHLKAVLEHPRFMALRIHPASTTLVTEVESWVSIYTPRIVREDVHESNGNDIDRIVVAVVAQSFL